MSIQKELLFQKIRNILDIRQANLGMDLDFVLYLIQKIIFHDCTQDALFKGKSSDYHGLPQTKSLFFAQLNCGLPIGNLTSQLFSNIYVHELDLFVKQTLQIRYYGRYVDDFFLIHSDKEYLASLIPQISEYLYTHLGLQLHPRKTYLQHYSKGVQFLGVVIKPYRSYIRKRTLGNRYQKIQAFNQQLHVAKKQGDVLLYQEILNDFVPMMNSYLGFLSHHPSYKKKKRILEKVVSPLFWEHFTLSEDMKRLR